MAQELFEYGSITRAFDSMVAMRGDDDAIIRFNERIEAAVDSSDDDKIVDDDEDAVTSSLSYSEIQFYSQQLAAILYHRFGVRCGDTVLLHCQHHTEAEVVACLAAARVGAPFIPIDSSWLIDDVKLSFVIEDTKPKVVIIVGKADHHPSIDTLSKHGLHRYAFVEESGALDSQELSISDIPELVQETTVAWEDLGRKILTPILMKTYYPLLNQQSDIGDINPISHYGYPLYILYTSGSTGRPKGVMGTNKSLLNRIAFQYKYFPFDFNEVVYRRTPLTFVDALVEIFAPLLQGIPLYTAPVAIRRIGNITEMILEVSRSFIDITRITMLPTQLAMVLECLPDWYEHWPNLKIVNISGEPCVPALVSNFSRLMKDCTLVNYYGSTEIGGDVTFAVLYSPSNDQSDAYDGDAIECINQANDVISTTDQQDIVFSSIGKAIANNHLFIVEEIIIVPSQDIHTNHTPIISPPSSVSSHPKTFQQVSPGETGELLVLGRHVALGYCQTPSATLERFLLNPVILAHDTGLPIALHTLECDNDELLYDAAAAADDDDDIICCSDGDNDDVNDTNEFHSKTKKNKINKHQSLLVLFRTGDIVKEDVSASPGVYTWLGRKDSQVKVRGVRVELEEAEARISQALGLTTTRQIALIATTSLTTTPSSSSMSLSSSTSSFITKIDPHLVLFIESTLFEKLTNDRKNDRNNTIDVFAIKQILLANGLPTLYLPSLTLPIQSLPRTVTGKVIRHDLETVIISLMMSTVVTTTPTSAVTQNAVARGSSNHVVSSNKKRKLCINETAPSSSSLALSHANDVDISITDVDDICNMLINIAFKILPILAHRFNAVTHDTATTATAAATTAATTTTTTICDYEDRPKNNHSLLLDKSFLMLGGDSMSAIEFSWHVKQQFHLSININDVMSLSLIDIAMCIYKHKTTTTTSIEKSIVNTNVVMNIDDSIDEKHEQKEGDDDVDFVDIAFELSSFSNDLLAFTKSSFYNCTSVTGSDTGSRSQYSPTQETSTDENTNQNLACLDLPTTATHHVEMKYLWNQSLLRCVDSSPVILQFYQINSSPCLSISSSINMSVVYIGSHGGDLIAVHAETNSLLWRLQLFMRIEATVAAYTGVNSLVGNDGDESSNNSHHNNFIQSEQMPLLFIPSYSANDVNGHTNRRRSDGKIGTLWCVHAVSGAVVWNTGFSGDLKSTPVVDTHRQCVIVGCYDGYVYRICISNGQILDSFNCDGSVYAKPILSNSSGGYDDGPNTCMFICSTKGKLHCIDFLSTSDESINSATSVPLSSQVITSNIPVMKLRYAIELDAPIYSTPVLIVNASSSSSSSVGMTEEYTGIDNNNRYVSYIIIGSVDGLLQCFDQSSGRLSWRCSAASRPIFATPCVLTRITSHNNTYANNIIFGCHDGVLRCIDSVTGSLLWNTTLHAVIFSSPTIAYGHNHHVNDEISQESVIIACTTAGLIYVLSCDDGAILSQIQIDAEIYSSPVCVNTSSISKIDNNTNDNNRLKQVLVCVGGRDDKLHTFSLVWKNR